MQKKLQKESMYADYDANNDGIVTDDELKHAKEIKQTEDASRKNLAQLRMARFSLIAMGVFTLAMFFIPIDRVNALADISNLFYITGFGGHGMNTAPAAALLIKDAILGEDRKLEIFSDSKGLYLKDNFGVRLLCDLSPSFFNGHAVVNIVEKK